MSIVEKNFLNLRMIDTINFIDKNPDLVKYQKILKNFGWNHSLKLDKQFRKMRFKKIDFVKITENTHKLSSKFKLNNKKLRKADKKDEEIAMDILNFFILQKIISCLVGMGVFK